MPRVLTTTHRPRDLRRSRGSRLLAPWRAMAAGLLALLVAPPAWAAKWETISKEELALRATGPDSSAGAEVLFWKVWLEDELRQNSFTSMPLVSTQRHYFRIKVHTAAAAQELSRHEVELSDEGRLVELAARTVQPDGSIAEMSASSVSRETVARRQGWERRIVTFAPPNVRPGCIIEYQYLEAHDDQLALFNTFPLQLDLPARRIVYHLRPASFEGWTHRLMAFRAALPPIRHEKGFQVVELSNVPAFRTEHHMPGRYQLMSWMLLYYTNQSVENPAQYWTEQAEEQSRDFQGWSRSDKALRTLAQETTAGATGDWDRLRRLAEWCRREIRVVRSNHPDSLKLLPSGTYDARSVLAKRAANPNDANLFFGALARAAGFEVRQTLVPSRRAISFTQEMVNTMFLSHAQVAVQLDDIWRPFGPESRWLPWDMVPWDREAQLSLFCDAKAPSFLRNLVAEPARSVRSRSGELSLDENGDLAGDVAVRLTGHWNERLHEDLESEPDTLKALRQTMQWGESGVELSRLRVTRVADDREEFAATVHVRMPGHAAEAGTRLLLEPAAWWAKRAPEFAESQRTWPVAFPFAWTDIDSLRVRLPEGWSVESLPAPGPVRAAGVAVYRLSFAAAEDGRALDCVRSFEMGQGGTLYFPVESYTDLQKLNDAFMDRDRTSVSLVRKQGSP